MALDCSAYIDGVEKGLFEPREAFAALLQDQQEELAAIAEGMGVTAGSLAFFTYHSLFPELRRVADRLAGLYLKGRDWQQGQCPVCGTPPALSFLDPGGERRLLCGFCWHGWRVSRVGCPFCRSGESGAHPYFYSDEEPEYRVDLCDSCKRYVKTVDSRKLDRPFYGPLEAVATLHLDLQASEKGYAGSLPDYLK
jgi:FdhE protein